jgi:hypothetical protein
MRNNKNFRILLGLCLVLSLLCISLWFFLQPFIASFPELLLGQISLSPGTKSPMPNKYLSAEFILSQVKPSDINRAVYIDLRKDVLFWDPHYVGFPRTELSNEEIRQIQQLLSSGNLFYRTPEGDVYKCVEMTVPGEPRLEVCAQGESYMDQFVSAQWESDQAESVGVLQFFLPGGKLAEIRVYRTPTGLAYDPYEKTGDWWFKGVTLSSPLLDHLDARASVPSIEILWPWMTASLANFRAAITIGDRYWSALEFVEKSPEVLRNFGEIQDIRPAVGLNNYSSWMDSTSIFLTFRLIGSKGEGAVIIQGEDCLDLQMVLEGVPIEDGEYYVCP